MAYEPHRPIAKILLIQLRGVGDVVMVSSLLDAIRSLFPGVQVHWLTDARMPELFVGDPRIDLFWIRPSRRRLLALARNLRREQFDLILDCQSLPVTAMLCKLAGGFSVGFKKRGRTPFYDWAVALGDHAGTGFTADHKLDLLRALGHRPLLVPPRLVPRPAAHAVWDALSTANRIVVVPSSAVAHKRWPPGQFAAVMRAVHQQSPSTFIIAGGPGESAQVHELATLCPDLPITTITAGSLGDFVAILQGARLFLGNDTGPRHMAAALGLATVAWFDTPNPSNWTPEDARRHPVIWDTAKALGRPIRPDLLVLAEDPHTIAQTICDLLAVPEA